MSSSIFRSRLSRLLVLCLMLGCSEQQSESSQEAGSEEITMTKEWQEKLSPPEILQFAKEGNERFVRGERYERDLRHDMRLTAESQHPAAIILSCIDSRAPAELVFDLGIGDVFNARVAGNFVNADIAGSIEYACKVAGAKLVIVMGHTQCGAVKSACDGVELGNITSMLANLNPAVEAVRDIEGERSSENPRFVAAVARQNVLLAKKRMTEISPILAEMVENGEIVIVGGMYDVKTGKVSFYD